MQVFAGSPGSHSMYVLPEFGHEVIPIDTTTNTALRPIELGSPDWQPVQIAFSSGAKTMYVISDYAYSRGWIPDTLITPVQTASGSVGKPFLIPGVVGDIIPGMVIDSVRSP